MSRCHFIFASVFRSVTTTSLELNKSTRRSLEVGKFRGFRVYRCKDMTDFGPLFFASWSSNFSVRSFVPRWRQRGAALLGQRSCSCCNPWSESDCNWKLWKLICWVCMYIRVHSWSILISWLYLHHLPHTSWFSTLHSQSHQYIPGRGAGGAGGAGASSPLHGQVQRAALASARPVHLKAPATRSSAPVKVYQAS